MGMKYTGWLGGQVEQEVTAVLYSLHYLVLLRQIYMSVFLWTQFTPSEREYQPGIIWDSVLDQVIPEEANRFQ